MQVVSSDHCMTVREPVADPVVGLLCCPVEKSTASTVRAVRVAGGLSFLRPDIEGGRQPFMRPAEVLLEAGFA